MSKLTKNWSKNVGFLDKVCFSVMVLSSVGSLICVVHDAEGSLKEDYRRRQWPRNPEAPRQHLTKIVSSEEILAHT